LSRLLPTGVAERIRARGAHPGDSEQLDVTVLMSDIRGYSTISEHTDPSLLAQQLNRHRAEMNGAILAAGGTVMQYVGDAVMAVFGAPEPSTDHADRALVAAAAMHASQSEVNTQWTQEGLEPFPLGIGLSTGVVAAALLGSQERLEYTVVGDAVNLCQRLQQFAADGEIVVSDATWEQLSVKPAAEDLGEHLVKGRTTPVRPRKIASVNRTAVSAVATQETGT
jgi:adenylate cyclase